MKTGTASGQAAKGRPCWLAAALMTTTLAGLDGHVARAATAQNIAAPAQASAQKFNIPAQKLGDALASFGAQSGWQVSVRADVIRNATSPGVNGSLTPADALSRLLAGTGFTYRLSGGHTVTLVPASANITLGPVRVGGTFVHQDPTGPGVGYFAENTMAGTKTNTPITEIPNSVHVITKQQMIDQQPQTLAQALRYMPGVYAEFLGTQDDGNANGSENSIRQRGFGSSIFVDGLMSSSSIAGEPTFLERVEVVNGPASVMYGQTTPGGMIGMSLKKPTEAPLHQVSVGFGNWGRYQANFDFSDKITKSGNVRFRIAGLGVTQGTQTEYVKYKKISVLPSLTWDIDKNTSWTLVGMYDYTPNRGTASQYPIRGTLITSPTIPRISRKTYLGLPNWNDNDIKGGMLESLFQHKFNKYVTFSQTFRWNKESIDNRTSYFGSSSSVNTAYVVPWWIKGTQNRIQFDARFSGIIKTGPLQHTWVVGSDFRDYDYTSSTNFDRNDQSSTTVNIYNPQPNYTPCYSLPSSTSCKNTLTSGKYNLFQEGVYFQDQIKWKRLSIVLGGRQDWVNRTATSYSWADNNATHKLTYKDTSTNPQPQSAFTWRAGILYNFDFGLTPYFSYSTSFVPQVSTDYLGRPFAPLSGKQMEVGLKYKVPNKDILITAAAYDITENHYLITDPVYTNYQTDAGTVRSRGFEVSANANVTKNLRVVASYSYTDTRFGKSNLTNSVYCPSLGKACSPTVMRAEAGQSVPYVPRNMFSVFADYTIPKNIVKGLGVNWGMRYIGYTYGNYVESFKVPSYILFDIGAHYDFGEQFPSLKGLHAQLAISNLTNKYYVTSCYQGSCNLGQGRRVYGNLTYNW